MVLVWLPGTGAARLHLRFVTWWPQTPIAGATRSQEILKWAKPNNSWPPKSRTVGLPGRHCAPRCCDWGQTWPSETKLKRQDETGCFVYECIGVWGWQGL